MKKIIFILLLAIVFWPSPMALAGLGSDLAGMILLNVEENGEAWYVYPNNNRRYFLGRPADAFRIMRELGLGITEIDFQKLAQAGMPVAGDIELARRLSGQIIIQVEKNGEAWYVYPKDLKKYYLGRPADAFRIMRELSLGITRDNLALVHKPGIDESIDRYSKYEHKQISTSAGSFNVDVVTIDLADPDLEIISDSAQAFDCESGCQARKLGHYVFENNGFAGINGTYFDTSAGKMNYYFFPVYNTRENILINEDQLKYWTTGPIMAFDENNKFYYFKDSREFQSVSHFEISHNAKLQAAIGNKPRLIENGQNLLIEWDIDEKQKTAKSSRNALAYKDNKILLVVAKNATVPDLADIMKALGVEHALNLDGGNSSALIYNGEYMVGPGRNIPNAIIFKKK